MLLCVYVFSQIFDPVSFTLVTHVDREPEAPFRGYHNMVALLKDATIIVAGGVHQEGDIGCEQPTIRLYEPPYLSIGPRPEWDANRMIANNQDLLLDSSSSFPSFSASALQPVYVVVGGSLSVCWNLSVPLRSHGGVVLMAVQAFTHAFGQNQVTHNFTQPYTGRQHERKKGDTHTHTCARCMCLAACVWLHV